MDGTRAPNTVRKTRWNQLTVEIISNAMSVYVFPCLRICKGKVVRADSHNGTVLLMNLLSPMSLNAGAVLNSPRKPGRSLKERSGDFTQWVEVNVVDDIGRLPYQCLFYKPSETAMGIRTTILSSALENHTDTSPTSAYNPRLDVSIHAAPVFPVMV